MLEAISLLVAVCLLASLGAALGSYYSALVMRANNISKASGKRSVCDHTGKVLPWYDLIPIFSFVLLRGRSRYTNERLDLRMFVAEILGFVLFAVFAVFLAMQVPVFTLLNLVYFFALVVLFYLAVYDLFTFSIPSQIVNWLLILAVAINVIVLVVRLLGIEVYFEPSFVPENNLLAAIVAGSSIWLLVRFTGEKGMGMGDVFVSAILGLLLGLGKGLAAFYFIVFPATVIGILLALRKGKFRGLQVPLVPFIAFGFVAALIWGEALLKLLFPGWW